MTSERDKASENPYEAPPPVQSQKSPIPHAAVVTIIFAITYGFSVFFAPADPYSVYLSTAALTLLGSLAYWVGLINGRRT